jgi:hypothetical protein
METQQARFDGWAIVDVMGHQRYVGYVTTEAYGAAVLFRIDVPALPERERATKVAGYVGGQYCGTGTIVREKAVPGYTKLVGSGSIYTITPCTEEAAMATLAREQPNELVRAALPAVPVVEWPDAPDDQHYDEDDDDLAPATES